MIIFQVKCSEQGLEIDLLKENKIEQKNVDKYMRNIVNELKLNGEINKNIILEFQEEEKENYENIRKLNEKFQEIKESKSIIEKEFDKLKLDGKRKQMEIDKLNKKLQEMESKFEIETKSKFEKEFDKLKLDGERNKKSIGTLEKKFEQQNENQIQQFNKKYQEIENKFVNAKQEREIKERDLMRNIYEMRWKQTEMRTMSKRIDQTMKNLENKLLEIEKINKNKMINVEFVWRIDKFNDKIKDAKNGTREIYSDSFYTHKRGYKMCLSVQPGIFGRGKDTYLSVWFYLMKGEFDDILQWPFKYDLTISLVNQQTTLDHVSRTKKYDNIDSHIKPIDERKYVGGFPFFIKLQEVLTNANLSRNNTIFIKCSANISS